MTFSWPRLTWPAWDARQAGPRRRKMSATSTAGRDNGGASAGHLLQQVERARHLAYRALVRLFLPTDPILPRDLDAADRSSSSVARTTGVSRFAMAASVASRVARCTELPRSRGPRVRSPCGRAHDDPGCI